MKRAGFTMIELIFVIVILGILAAVAIPKLTATRTDAKASRGASDAATALQDMGAYFTAKGNFADDPADMTNVAFDGNNTHNGVSLLVDSKKCLKYTTNDDNGTVKIEDGADASETVCTAVKSALDIDGKTHKFGGTGITY